MAVNVDDPLLPVDNALSSPAAEGAAEFRALKAKVNSLFLSSGVGLTYTNLIDTNGKGLNVAISDASNQILQSGRFKITRTASQPKDTLGMYSESVLAVGVTCPANILSAFYSITTANTGSSFQAMYCLNSLVVQQVHNNNGLIVGLYVVFANRTSPGVAAPSGLGSNQYNKNSVAFAIGSYARSSSGEYCGWKNGIVFEPNALDRDIIAAGYGIDFSQLTLVGLGADPFVAYKFKAAIKLASQQAIIMDGADSIAFYYDSLTDMVVFSKGGVRKIEFYMNTGDIYRHGVLIP